jgi:flagellar basal-body rod modification protein FlgD
MDLATATAPAPAPAFATAAAAAAGQTAAGGRAAASDYDTFLRMLTVQMQNQDPLNPIESTDYAVQLATFSSVEQQTRTNQLIEKMLAQMSLAGMADLAGWVGREVLAAAPVAFTGAPVELAAAADARADRAVLVVRDAAGAVVAREPVPPGAATFAWSGRAADGSPAPAGTYAFTLESYLGEDRIAETPAAAYARVTEVRGTAEGPRLVLAGGIEVAAADIRALRG